MSEFPFPKRRSFDSPRFISIEALPCSPSFSPVSASKTSASACASIFTVRVSPSAISVGVIDMYAPFA